MSVQSGFGPVWGPRGDEFLYRRASGGAVISVEMSTDPDAGLVPGQPIVLFRGPFRTCCPDGRTFDVAPDGERFLMMREELGEGVRRIEVVQNFVADVLRRVYGTMDSPPVVAGSKHVDHWRASVTTAI